MHKLLSSVIYAIFILNMYITEKIGIQIYMQLKLSRLKVVSHKAMKEAASGTSTKTQPYTSTLQEQNQISITKDP